MIWKKKTKVESHESVEEKQARAYDMAMRSLRDIVRWRPLDYDSTREKKFSVEKTDDSISSILSSDNLSLEDRLRLFLEAFNPNSSTATFERSYRIGIDVAKEILLMNGNPNYDFATRKLIDNAHRVLSKTRSQIKPSDLSSLVQVAFGYAGRGNFHDSFEYLKGLKKYSEHIEPESDRDNIEEEIENVHNHVIKEAVSYVLANNVAESNLYPGRDDTFFGKIIVITGWELEKEKDMNGNVEPWKLEYVSRRSQLKSKISHKAENPHPFYEGYDWIFGRDVLKILDERDLEDTNLSAGLVYSMSKYICACGTMYDRFFGCMFSRGMTDEQRDKYIDKIKKEEISNAVKFYGRCRENYEGELRERFDYYLNRLNFSEKSQVDYCI